MREVMNWYNPTTRSTEDADAPMSEAQAIEMLSGHPESDRFIEEYRRKRSTSEASIVEALIFTGELVYWEHRREQLTE
jgi:hypothetical protein